MLFIKRGPRLEHKQRISVCPREPESLRLSKTEAALRDAASCGGDEWVGRTRLSRTGHARGVGTGNRVREATRRGERLILRPRLGAGGAAAGSRSQRARVSPASLKTKPRGPVWSDVGLFWLNSAAVSPLVTGETRPCAAAWAGDSLALRAHGLVVRGFDCGDTRVRRRDSGKGWAGGVPAPGLWWDSAGRAGDHRAAGPFGRAGGSPLPAPARPWGAVGGRRGEPCSHPARAGIGAWWLRTGGPHPVRGSLWPPLGGLVGAAAPASVTAPSSPSPVVPSVPAQRRPPPSLPPAPSLLPPFGFLWVKQ